MEEAADTDIMEDMYRGYENLTDEEILLDIKEHNNKVALDYLINKYRNFVRAKARSYFLIGADREDIVQEGMIGFYKAIRDFRDDKLSSFRAFAELCVTRQIITAIKTATRQKHIPLNSYVSLNKPIYDEDSDRTLLDISQVPRCPTRKSSSSARRNSSTSRRRWRRSSRTWSGRCS